jgi:hypothetical protein
MALLVDRMRVSIVEMVLKSQDCNVKPQTLMLSPRMENLLMEERIGRGFLADRGFERCNGIAGST